MHPKTALIIGAGPAGLTAAYELLAKTDIVPIIYEMDNEIGGLCKTMIYRGNCLDIGGHRFFSKSSRILKWWQNILPLQGAAARDDLPTLRNRGEAARWAHGGPDPEQTDRVLLLRRRCSRIYFNNKFFDYPLSLNVETIINIGFLYTAKIAWSYFKSHLRPIRPQRSLEDFLINRFGNVLYQTFFKSYTEKVWGMPCRDIKPEWGEQRIRGLSLAKAILSKFRPATRRKRRELLPQDVEPSLIERFLYPKYGPGQLWQEVGAIVLTGGGKIHRNHKVTRVTAEGSRILAAEIMDLASGNIFTQAADYFISTMPIQELIAGFGDVAPEEVYLVAQGLSYRDFITVGVLLKKLKPGYLGGSKGNELPPDNWIYIHEPRVKVGRIQIFNNWSPYLVRDPGTVWLGMEYFENQGGDLWRKSDADIAGFAVRELVQIGLIELPDVIDSTVVRVRSAYPVYSGSYDRLDTVRRFTDGFENLFLIGRNGMHRYNNQDHSMLTAMVAVENIINGVKTKDNIWAVNLDGEYHEESSQ